MKSYDHYLQTLTKEMELRGMRPSSIQSYLRTIKDYMNFHQNDPKELGLQGIKDYLHHYQHREARGRKRSPNSVNNAASSLSFFYRFVFNQNFYGEVPRMRAKKPAPTILSQAEITHMIDNTYNLLWKCVIMMLYTTGMRQSELRNLKIKDIDSSRMVLYIREAKGAKDRQASLSPTLLECLRKYWQYYRIERNQNIKSDYLFIPNKNSYDGNLCKKLSHTAVDYIVKRAAEKAGIKKKFILTA